MKNLKPLIIFLVLASSASCNQAKKVDDPEVLKKVLSDYFDGIAKRDLNKMNSVTTKDFILFEDGNVWNNDSLINALSAVNSFQCVWTFDYKRIAVDEVSGDIVYFNHADMIINDTTQVKVDWIESATFRKVDDEWKINLLHSTIRK